MSPFSLYDADGHRRDVIALLQAGMTEVELETRAAWRRPLPFSPQTIHGRYVSDMRAQAVNRIGVCRELRRLAAWR